MAGPISRRRFLATSAAATVGAVAFAACGGDDEPSAEDDGTSTTSGSSGSGELSLIQFFGGGPQFVAGTTVRAPFGLADKDGLLEVGDTPAKLTVTVLGPDEKAIADPITIARRSEGIPRPYYPLVVPVTDPGIYSARVDYEGVAADLSFQVNRPEEVAVIKAGDTFPALETPTPDDARGVNPICTATPACPLHDVTAAQALTEGRPLAFLVATPAFCQISVCGPVLDVLRTALPNHPNVRGLHAEVHPDPFTTTKTFAPTPLALKLFSEPVLVLVGSDGIVQQRVDTLFDVTELDELLAGLA